MGRTRQVRRLLVSCGSDSVARLRHRDRIRASQKALLRRLRRRHLRQEHEVSGEDDVTAIVAKRHRPPAPKADWTFYNGIGD